MGLDSVEFVMELEDAFEVAIADEVAYTLVTPRKVVDYLAGRLAGDGPVVCLEQRAFHRLRLAAMQVLGARRRDIAPDTLWAAILPDRGRRSAWQALGRAAAIAPWPGLTMLGSVPPEMSTVGAASRHAATTAPASLRREGETWSRAEIEATVASLMHTHLGIEAFGWDQEFVRDLGID